MISRDDEAWETILECIYHYGTEAVQHVLNTITRGTFVRNVQDDSRQFFQADESEPLRKARAPSGKRTKKNARKKTEKSVKRRRGRRASPEQQKQDAAILALLKASGGAHAHLIQDRYREYAPDEIRKSIKRLMFRKHIKSEPVPGKSYKIYRVV
jgi:hypothetical protein